MSNQLSRSDFIYLTNYAQAALSCTKEEIKIICSGCDYCEITYCDRGKESYVYALEIDLNGVALYCYFGEKSICEASYLFLNDTEMVNKYMKLCNTLFSYNPQLKIWLSSISFIKYIEEEEDKKFGFFSLTE